MPYEFNADEVACMKELKLNQDHIKTVITDDAKTFLPEDDEEFNSYIHCYWVKTGTQNEAGDLQYQNIIEFIQRFGRSQFGGKSDDTRIIGTKIAREAVEGCKNLPKGKTPGQTAVQAQNCIDKRMIELVKLEN